jgi:hypothetical protein
MRVCQVFAIAVLFVVAAVVPANAANAPNPANAVNPAQATHSLNNFRCVPSRRHPNPVVLLHGSEGSIRDWSSLVPQLTERGYCVFAPDYGAIERLFKQVNGMQSVDVSAHEVKNFIDTVLRATGGKQVDLVAHSEGGLLALYMAKFLGVAPELHRIVGLAPPTHGTDMSGLVEILQATMVAPPVLSAVGSVTCPSCEQLLRGSALIARLTKGPIAMPGIGYTVIASRDDISVTPTDTAFIREPGVRNMYVQDVCPYHHVQHADLPRDRIVEQLVRRALDPANTPPPTCTVRNG